MIWPPVKAWTSNKIIEGQRHFIAINYGGKLLNKWVILMSVLDSSLVFKVLWVELVDSSAWEIGWGENNQLETSKIINSKFEIRSTKLTCPSVDSGLTIPITENIIRPWFVDI